MLGCEYYSLSRVVFTAHLRFQQNHIPYPEETMTQSDQSLSNVSELDSLDQQIVVLLRTDGRMSFTEISKRLSIPEATARYRVQRLLQSGLIQITAWPNPEKLGRPNVLILWLTIDKGQIDAVSEQLASMNEVRFAATLIGR